MTATPILSSNTRMFIVLVAIVQGLLLYLAHTGTIQDWWPLSALGGRIYWYTLVLAVPTLMILTVGGLRDPRYWQHIALVTGVFAAMASWAAWSATGAPGLDSSSVLHPFGTSVAIALFVACPWLQFRQEHGHWNAPYPVLFEHAWQNALTLALACLFVGICWMVLFLWAGLFELVEVGFFQALFQEKAFIYPATGAMFGLGILIGRTQHRPIQIARQVLLAIFKGLLPLLAFIAVLFVASLPFTGLEPLWSTRSAAAILLCLATLLIVFVNAVFQDGNAGSPYPMPLRRLVEAGLLVLPVYTLLALFALWLRIDQYGWTSERFWAVLATVLVTGYALGYAWAVLRPGNGWLQPVRRINKVLALGLVGIVVLANLPVLDPHRIGVASQLGRLDDGRTAADQMDLEYLRFESGRRGYAAAESLRDRPPFEDDETLLTDLEQTLARPHRHYYYPGREALEKSRIRSVAEARAHITRAEGSTAPDDTWWSRLVEGELGATRCLQPGSECILIERDLDGNGVAENLLCLVRTRHSAHCEISTLEGDEWSLAGSIDFWHESRDDRTAMRQALLAGRIETHQQRWPEVSIGEGTPRAVSPPLEGRN